VEARGPVLDVRALRELAAEATLDNLDEWMCHHLSPHIIRISVSLIRMAAAIRPSRIAFAARSPRRVASLRSRRQRSISVLIGIGAF
jgi:hypothetical protein